MVPIRSALRFTLAFTLAATGAFSATARAQTLVRASNGPAANALYGKACIVVADQNGDGFADVLVGAPGFNQQRGAVYCLSGAYLASGIGAQTLWSVAPSANQGDLFGFAIADVGDVTGDGLADFLVGQPGYDSATANDLGAVRLIHGSSHAVIGTIDNAGGQIGDAFGSALASCGDTNGDGKSEVAIAAPGTSVTDSHVWFLGGQWLTSSAHLFDAAYAAVHSSETLGNSLASGFDLDGDGFQEVVVGYPTFDAFGLPDSGEIAIFHAQQPNSNVTRFESMIAHERLGTSLDAAYDYDGDGVIDIVVGAPNALDSSGGEAGRVAVLSGARLIAQSPPYDIRSLSLGLGTGGFHYHFGAAVRASPDLNGDGVGEILVGAPDYFTIGAGGTLQNKGLVAVFSGSTGIRWDVIGGGNTDKLGDAIAGAVDDLDGDGFREFVVAGSVSDAGGTDSGVVKCYRVFPVAPVTYCAGKINSQGCTPSISSSGSPSATATAPFLVTATSLVNKKVGLLIYSHKPAAVVFQGGTLCVGFPTIRTPPQSSGGSASGNDCTGAFSFDFNDRILNGPDPTLVAGAEVFAQYWARDPQSPSHSSLSNAIRFLINP